MSAELINIYDKLYKNAIEKIKCDQYDIDHMIDAPVDKRFGITLIIKPNEEVIAEIQRFLSDLNAMEPDQYYYPSSDIHVTCLPIIPCHENFDLNQIRIEDYVDLINANIPRGQDLQIHFEGITASSSCIMIQGFPQQTVFNELRDKLRTAFKSSTLQYNIDQRYFIQTAHATVVRFRKPFLNKTHFLEVLENYRNHNFGTNAIKEIDLVYNDWYLRKNVVKTLFRFEL